MSIGIYQTNQNTTSAYLIDEERKLIIGEVDDYRYPQNYKKYIQYLPAPDWLDLVFKGIFR